MSAIKKWFLYIFCLAAFYFYSPAGVSGDLLKIVHSAAVILTIIYVLNKWLSRALPLADLYLAFPMKLMCFAILFSIVPAYASWDQPMLVSLMVLLPTLVYFFYFFLIYIQPSLFLVEKIILNIGLITVTLSIISLLIYPTVLYGGTDTETVNLDRGFARIATPGEGFIFLSFFLCLNKYLVSKTPRWILFAALFLVGIFITLTRQSILSTMILGFLMVTVQLKTTLSKVVAVAICFGITLVVMNLEFVQNLIDLSKKQVSGSETDIRFLSGNYFLTEFSPDMFTAVFGNGEPGIGKTDYGSFVQRLKDVNGFYQSDVGFIGFYSKFGLIGIVAWMLIFIRMYLLKLSGAYVYVKYFIFFFLFTGVTAAFSASSNYIITVPVALYVAELAKKPFKHD